MAIKSSLSLCGLELAMHLGLHDNERSQKQIVLLDIVMVFKVPPAACLTDQIEDTYCYATLVEKIKKEFETKAFQLIEHMGQEIYAYLRSLILDASIKITLTKHPHIEGLTGGASFSYGDID